jgi:excisionase family DNA binding protein
MAHTDNDGTSGHTRVVDMDSVYTLSEASKLLKVNEKTLRRILTSGGIYAKKVGRQWRIPGKTLIAYVQEQPST